jgi:hypothetical protein
MSKRTIGIPKPTFLTEWFEETYQLGQLESMAATMCEHGFGQEYLFFNLHDIFKKGFPFNRVTEIRIAFNHILKFNGREVVETDEIFKKEYLAASGKK